MIKFSDYVFKYLSQKGLDTVFTVSGGAAAHLLDSLGKSNFKYVCNNHEQACAMSAEGYARIANKPAIVLVTNGPGSTNAITGVIGAYQDSIPMIVISGQVPTSQSMTSCSHLKLRQMGVQECNIIEIVSSITKFACKITDIKTAASTLNMAYNIAVSGRKGPVWLDIPIDIQNKMIEDADFDDKPICTNYVNTKHLLQKLKDAKRPLIIAGNGIHLSKTENQFLNFVKQTKIPCVSTWTAKDLFAQDNPLFIGNFGIIGERSANYAIQNADVVLILGSRLSILNVGYQSHLFARDAYKIMVDIDENEIMKPSLSIDLPIVVNLNNFFEALVNIDNYECEDWNKTLLDIKNKHDIFQEPHLEDDISVNSYRFIKELSKHLDDHIVVTDMGTSYTCTMQALRTNGKNRLFTSSACCSMGFGLPGAIGASLATEKPIICIAGDGGFQMNIQELQTIITNKIPIKIFVLNNQKYLAITIMQENLFDKAYVASENTSGVVSPDFYEIAKAYGLKACKINSNEDLSLIPDVLSEDGPVLCEINMNKNQLMIPRVQSEKDINGNIVSNPLDKMYPYIEI
jgi:acetolactate synthase-1/2/3 large subunit